MKKTPHQQRVEEFMRLAKQELPDGPIVPDAKVRELRAKLIFEEALETIAALGITAEVLDNDCSLCMENVEFYDTHEPDLEQIADGCADLSVVTIGTLCACGIADESLLELVDANNLAKFGPGHSIREDGKLVKPADHQPPDILGLLIDQGLGG